MANVEALTAEAIRILNKHDLAALRPGLDGVPETEYDLEARDLVARLLARGSVSADDVHEVWRDWFGETAIPDDVAAAIASKLAALR